MAKKMVCGMCKKVVIREQDDNGKWTNTRDIFVDKWGNDRNFCKECLNRKGNNQRWKY